MAWGFFKAKTQRSPNPPPNRSSKPSSSKLVPSPLPPPVQVATASLAPSKISSTSKTRRTNGEPRSRLDPESSPLRGSQYSHFTDVPTERTSAKLQDPDPVANQLNTVKRHSSTQSVRSVRSARSISSFGHSSNRSLRSSTLSVRARHIKAAHAAKRAAAAFIAENRGNSMHCYTCGNELYSIRCGICRTAYMPPQFHYDAASAALLVNNNFSSGYNSLDRILGGPLPGNSASTHFSSTSDGRASSAGSEVSEANASDMSGSISGAESLLGCYPENEVDFDLTTNKLDLELIKDLATCDEAGLLEEVIFECFSNPDAVVNTFCKKSPHYRRINPSTIPNHSIPSEIVLSEMSASVEEIATINFEENSKKASPEIVTPYEYKMEGAFDNDNSLIDCNSVNTMYALLASVSSITPMRGILQGAQAVLQVRKHTPLTERELIYICVVLQCPAITDCSMFTKITGPMQKLSRYAGLRSRARTVLEVCAGLVAHSDECLHPIFTQIFSSVNAEVFGNIVDLSNAYISHRLVFDFHDKTNSSRPTRYHLVRHDWYAEDWRIAVVVKFLSLLSAANGLQTGKKVGNGHSTTAQSGTVLPGYRFYNTMVDFIDLKSDYESWQLSSSFKKPKFCFCRYPFLLSMGAKAKVFEYAVQRQVNSSIQRELFAMMMRPQSTQSLELQQIELASLRTLKLQVRRQHLLADSIKQLQNWSNTPKQRFLKVEFEGEPGIDAGGLKKEWFYLFNKQIFDPELKVFIMDETSNYCWFGDNPDLRYYRAAGMVLGFALFNGITVDINLPLLLFKLLLDRDYDLNDIGTLWPEISQSLQSILDYDEEDFEYAFGLVFTAPDGTLLMPNGDDINVTLSNKEFYVELVVKHLINVGSKPLQTFKDAFNEVCGGNAMILFQPDELELLVRGDRKPIDIPALRSVTKYVNFGHRYEKANLEPVIQWFWEFFEKLDPSSQARLLQFVTSTDRAPAAGMVHMRFSIKCLGEDSERLPIAHTCFNQLCIYKYKSRKKLERKLSLAIVEYQGFGLK